MPRNASEIRGSRFYDWQGQKVPSVTTILSAYPQPWAIPFGAKHAANRAVDELPRLVALVLEDREDARKWLKRAPTDLRDSAADTGTDLHSYLEARLLGSDTWEAVRDPGETARRAAIDSFLYHYRPEPLAIEAQVYNLRDGWAGSADLFARVQGRPLCIDLKTETAGDENHKSRLQLAAYRNGQFIGEDGVDLGEVPETDGAAVLWVPREHPQDWRLFIVEAGGPEYETFLATKRLWEFYHENDGEPVGFALDLTEDNAA